MIRLKKKKVLMKMSWMRRILCQFDIADHKIITYDSAAQQIFFNLIINKRKLVLPKRLYNLFRNITS